MFTGAITLLSNLLDILVFVHQNKVIHRDIKPNNIMKRKDGQIILIDFGAVKQVQTCLRVIPKTTTKRVAICTPGYMPTEQTSGKPRFSSDIYAVGMIGIQALTGILPHELPEDPQTGEINWRHLVSVNDNFADILNQMVRYDWRERYPSAVEALDALKTIINPVVSVPVTLPNQAQQFLDKGNVLCELKQYEKAILSYEEAIVIKPNFYQAWLERGKALFELERYQDALSSVEKAIEIKPDYADAWYNRGIALYNLKRYQEAIQCYDKTIAIKPDFADAWNGRGAALYHLNRYQEAIQSYGQAIAIKPDFTDARLWRQNAINKLRS